MALPTTLTFNELSGEEVAHVLENRFQQIVRNVPYFQPHLTLPRVRMTLRVELQIWADQPSPETVTIGDMCDVVLDTPAIMDTIVAESVDIAAPVPGGHPPDKIREMHNLPVSRPARGPREIGAQIVTSDTHSLEGREIEDLPGLKVSRTGDGMIDGMPTSSNATIAKIDQGPAGLRRGQNNRDAWRFGGGK